jgi:hypothetical protein
VGNGRLQPHLSGIHSHSDQGLGWPTFRSPASRFGVREIAGTKSSVPPGENEFKSKQVKMRLCSRDGRPVVSDLGQSAIGGLR